MFWPAGISLAEAQAAGWTFQPPPHVTYMLPWSATEIGRYPWRLLPDLSGNLIAVVFVTASSALFNTTGLEVAVHREANLERELSVTGLANVPSGAFGGYTGCVSVSRSVLNFSSGGRGRLSGLTVAAESGARLETPDLFRLRDGRAPDLRQSHDRGAQEIAGGGVVGVRSGRST